MFPKLVYPTLDIEPKNGSPLKRNRIKTINKTNLYKRKVLGNEEFPKWNPQTEFTSVEENSVFQGFYAFKKPME